MDLKDTKEQDIASTSTSAVRMQIAISTGVVLFLILGILVAVGFRNPRVGLSASLEQTESLQVPEPVAEPLVNPLEECVHRMPIPFGGKARTKCLLNCYAPGVDTPLCEKVCDQRNAENFAGSLLWQGHSPKPVAEKIATDCLDRSLASKEPVSRTEWADKTAKIVEFLEITEKDVELYQREDLSKRFSQFEKIDAVLPNLEKPSSPQQKFLQQLNAVLCLRQSIATTQLAVLEAAESSDTFSERFYRSVEETLLSSARVLEAPLSAAYMAAVVDQSPDA